MCAAFTRADHDLKAAGSSSGGLLCEAVFVITFFGKTDSEWRAWLIAARASKRLGNEAATDEYASYAVNRLSELEQKWGSEAYNSYLTRSDVMYFRKQTQQLLNP